MKGLSRVDIIAAKRAVNRRALLSALDLLSSRCLIEAAIFLDEFIDWPLGKEALSYRLGKPWRILEFSHGQILSELCRV